MGEVFDVGMDQLNLISEKIINCAFEVSNKLGAGFLEKVYENAMVIELSRTGLSVKQQAPIQIYYDEYIIGDYIADLFVEDKIIVELKTVKSVENIHQAQLLNYLKATGAQLGLIINFYNPKVEIKRMLNTK